MPNVTPVYLDRSFLGTNSFQGLYYSMMPTSFASNIFNGYGMDWGNQFLGQGLFTQPSNSQSNTSGYNMQSLSTPEQIMSMQMPTFTNTPITSQSGIWGSYDIINPFSINAFPNGVQNTPSTQNTWTNPTIQNTWTQPQPAKNNTNSSNVFNNWSISTTPVRNNELIKDIKNSYLFTDKEKIIASKLQVLTQEKLVELKKEATKRNLNFKITFGYRTFDYQAQLREDWKDPAKRKERRIAAIPANAGNHHSFGYAVDFSIPKASLSDFAKLAKSLNWRWGGDFSNNYDPYHIDLEPIVGSTEELKKSSAEYKAWAQANPDKVNIPV